MSATCSVPKPHPKSSVQVDCATFLTVKNCYLGMLQTSKGEGATNFTKLHEKSAKKVSDTLSCLRVQTGFEDLELSLFLRVTTLDTMEDITPAVLSSSRVLATHHEFCRPLFTALYD